MGALTRCIFHEDKGINGIEIWESDRTAAGTMMVKQFATGPFSSNLSSLTSFTINRFFVADDGLTGYEL